MRKLWGTYRRTAKSNSPSLPPSLPSSLSSYLGDGDGGADVEALAQVGPKGLLLYTYETRDKEEMEGVREGRERCV